MLFYLRLRQLIGSYLHERLFILALVSILFIMGIIFGALAAGMLETNQARDLLNYINQGLQTPVVADNLAYTHQIIIANIQTVFFLFFMGISVIGVPLALLLIFTRGFILGFSSGFLIHALGFKGLIITMTGIIPHNLLIIPALFLMLIAIIDCAAALTKIRFSKKNVSLRDELLKCVLLTLIVLVFMVLAGFVQGYITTTLSAWLAPFI